MLGSVFDLAGQCGQRGLFSRYRLCGCIQGRGLPSSSKHIEGLTLFPGLQSDVDNQVRERIK